MNLYDRKIVQNIYCFLIWGWYDTLNNRYLYKNYEIIMRLFVKIKKQIFLKFTQQIMHAINIREKDI